MPQEQSALADPTVAATAELPDSVQRKLTNWAADSLNSLPVERVPVSLRRVARFAPAKRARAGSGPLLAALDSDPVFRAHVAEHARTAAGAPPGRGPVEVIAESAAQAFLLHLPAAAALLAEAESADQLDRLQRRIYELTGELERNSAARKHAESERDSLLAARTTDGGSATATADIDKLRGRLREQGTTIRDLKDRLESQQAQAGDELVGFKTDLARSRAEVKSLQDRLEASRVRANRAAEQVKAMASEAAAGHHTADRRVDLLLQTLEDGVSGLRQQLRLRHGGADPADAVADQLPMTVRGTLRPADSALLADWLTLPKAHLIVDGYNISKTGYATMTLADQRERLVRELAAVAARTSCEVTLVFDGAAVVAPQSRVRGVRVIFSPPGVIADEVIRRLVLAEPIGRVLIVATADKEILDSVTNNGARTVTPEVLLTLISG